MSEQKQTQEVVAAVVRSLPEMTTAQRQRIIEATGERLTAVLAKLDSVLSGTHQIVPMEHVIDCDADPFCPDGWKVESHQKSGQFQWNPAKVNLFLADAQQNGRTEIGTELQKVLVSQKVMNANVLDWLCVHPQFIPEYFKGKAVFFWGTIYRDSDGTLCVRYLLWDGSHWRWYCNWLDHRWDDSYPAAVRAS